MSELSDDARVLVSVWFGFGEKTKVEVGGSDAKSVLSPRGKAAIDELVAAKLVTAERINNKGRMRFTGKPGCCKLKLSIAKVDELGDWSPTMPNPERTP